MWLTILLKVRKGLTKLKLLILNVLDLLRLCIRVRKTVGLSLITHFKQILIIN